MGLQLRIFVMYVVVLAAAGRKALAALSTQAFSKLLLKVLLKPLIGGSDREFRKISEDLLISAAVPQLYSSSDSSVKRIKVCC